MLTNLKHVFSKDFSIVLNSTMKPLSFVIVGSGWRSLFYVRIAKRYPKHFRLLYMLCRTEEKADAMAKDYGIATTTSESICEQAYPDFVVIAVTKGNLFAETKKWSEKGFPVLSETPVAANVAELKTIWNMVQNGAKIQVAEQYHRYPVIASGLREIAEGKIAEPNAVELSVAHDYHGISLIRRMLQPHEPLRLKLKSVRGVSYHFPVTETNSREGVITDGSVKERERVRITMEFQNGKVAFYDFDKVQYHSFIRSRHLQVQGANGEWNDTIIRYVNSDSITNTKKIFPLLEKKYGCLETRELQNLKTRWCPYVIMDDMQDEYAIATMMYDMREYIEYGTEIYPLAEALEDTYIWLLFQEAIKYPNKEILPEAMPWQI